MQSIHVFKVHFKKVYQSTGQEKLDPTDLLGLKSQGSENTQRKDLMNAFKFPPEEAVGRFLQNVTSRGEVRGYES